MAQPVLVVTLKDVSEESSVIELPLPAITDGATLTSVGDLSSPTSKASLLVAGIRAVTACEVISAQVKLPAAIYNNALPGNFLSAHRELKMLFKYRDTVTGEYRRISISGPDTLAMGGPTAGTDNYPLIDPVIAAWKLVFEANAKSPDGNAVELKSARIVGRNV